MSDEKAGVVVFLVQIVIELIMNQRVLMLLECNIVLLKMQIVVDTYIVNLSL